MPLLRAPPRHRGAARGFLGALRKLPCQLARWAGLWGVGLRGWGLGQSLLTVVEKETDGETARGWSPLATPLRGRGGASEPWLCPSREGVGFLTAGPSL